MSVSVFVTENTDEEVMYRLYKLTFDFEEKIIIVSLNLLHLACCNHAADILLLYHILVTFWGILNVNFSTPCDTSRSLLIYAFQEDNTQSLQMSVTSCCGMHLGLPTNWK